MLEASPSKPSVSSVVLMTISRHFNNITTCNIYIFLIVSFLLTTQVVGHGAHFVPCKLEVDGESKADCPLFTAPPRANGSREGDSSTQKKKSVWSPLFSWLITSRPSKLAGVITMLGSLVRMPRHQQSVPASSATLRQNTVRFAATAVRIFAHCVPERPREPR